MNVKGFRAETLGDLSGGLSNAAMAAEIIEEN